MSQLPLYLLRTSRKMQAPTRYCDVQQGVPGKVQMDLACGIYVVEKLNKRILQQLICLTTLM